MSTLTLEREGMSTLTLEREGTLAGEVTFMDDGEEALQVIEGSCVGKFRYGGRAAAHAAARRLAEGQDRPFEAYRCPFAAAQGLEPHWHAGSTPSVEHMHKIAAAIRWLHQSSSARVEGLEPPARGFGSRCSTS